jgi:hypothetical protein
VLTRPFSTTGAVAIAVLHAAIGLLPENSRQLPPFAILATLMLPAILVGVPFAYWIPNMRVGQIGPRLPVPSQTYMLPRFVVCLSVTTMLGASAGTLVLAVLADARYGLLFVMQLSATIAIFVSAQRRFRQHPSSEFVMRSPFPYPLRKRM